MIKLLIYAVIILAVLSIAWIIRIMELTNRLTGEDDSKITVKDNRFNSRMMLFFLFATMTFFIYITLRYKQYLLPVSASAHGVTIDTMFNVTMLIISIVFFITQILLFYFAFKYKHSDDRRAYFFSDSHKLEIIWTVIPTIVLVSLVVYGLNVWNKITAPAGKNAMVIEIYGKQFDWTARYAGTDNHLGKSNYRLISGSNIMGMDSSDVTGNDDVITKELHLPVNTPILLVMHSRDVIHSAYLPHFRVQMNSVPGMSTQFAFTPTITTEQMRKITNNDKFDYILLCAKLCGTAHFNMQMKVVCDTKLEFNAWMKKQKTVAETRKTEKEVASK